MPSKQYKLSVNFDTDVVSISDGTEVCELRRREFVKELFGYKLPFADLSLPKVMVYASNTIIIDDKPIGFCIVEMNPRIHSYEGTDTFMPWTHMFVFLDVKRQRILESVLFFSDRQLMSEMSHMFHTPYCDSNELKKSEWMEKVFDIDTPVLSTTQQTGQRFAHEVATQRKALLHQFFYTSSLNVKMTDKAEEFVNLMSSFFSDHRVDIGQIDSKVQEHYGQGDTFTGQVRRYFEKNKGKTVPKPEPSYEMRFAEAAKPKYI